MSSQGRFVMFSIAIMIFISSILWHVRGFAKLEIPYEITATVTEKRESNGCRLTDFSYADYGIGYTSTLVHYLDDNGVYEGKGLYLGRSVYGDAYGMLGELEIGDTFTVYGRKQLMSGNVHDEPSLAPYYGDEDMVYIYIARFTFVLSLVIAIAFRMPLNEYHYYLADRYFVWVFAMKALYYSAFSLFLFFYKVKSNTMYMTDFGIGFVMTVAGAIFFEGVALIIIASVLTKFTKGMGDDNSSLT